MPDRAVNLYREAGRLSLDHSAATADPELMVTAPEGSRVEAGELVVPWLGQDVQLGPGQVALAARFGYFGLAVFWESGMSWKDTTTPGGAKPKGRPKRGAGREAEAGKDGPGSPAEVRAGDGVGDRTSEVLGDV